MLHVVPLYLDPAQDCYVTEIIAHAALAIAFFSRFFAFAIVLHRRHRPVAWNSFDRLSISLPHFLHGER
jgi:hypothetical protein